MVEKGVGPGPTPFSTKYSPLCHPHHSATRNPDNPQPSHLWHKSTRGADLCICAVGWCVCGRFLTLTLTPTLSHFHSHTYHSHSHSHSFSLPLPPAPVGIQKVFSEKSVMHSDEYYEVGRRGCGGLTL